MMHKKNPCTHILMVCLILVFSSTQASAQVSTSSSARRGLATVIFAGLGGAVLGLSTLSFYGEPQEHIGNIWTGLFLGAAGGSAYVLSSATQPSSNYDSLHLAPPRKNIAPTVLAWSWDF